MNNTRPKDRVTTMVWDAALEAHAASMGKEEFIREASLSWEAGRIVLVSLAEDTTHAD